MANYVRCIVFSNKSGSKEGVIFTEDLETPIDEFIIPSGCTVDSENDIKLSDLPEGFPLDYILKRTSLYDF